MTNKDVEAGKQYWILYSSLETLIEIFNDSTDNKDFCFFGGVENNFFMRMTEKYNEFITLANKYHIKDSDFYKIKTRCEKILNTFK